MPGLNMLKILYPSRKIDDLYDRMSDFVTIVLKGKGVAPTSEDLEVAAEEQWNICSMLSDPNKQRECMKKALGYEQDVVEIMAKEKKLGAANVEVFIKQKMSDAESLFANDPFSFVEASRGLYRKAFEDMSALLDAIPERNYKNYTDIDKFTNLLKKYKEEAEDLATLSNAMKSQNEKALNYFGIAYNPSPAGIISTKAFPTYKMPSGAKPTNLKTPEGLPVYIIDPKPFDESPFKKVRLGNLEFRYIGATKMFRAGDIQNFNWDLLGKREVSTVSWGDYLQDSQGIKYFVTKEGKLAPVSDEVFSELGGTENRIQKMTSWEEKYDLPQLRTKPIKLPPEIF